MANNLSQGELEVSQGEQEKEDRNEAMIRTQRRTKMMRVLLTVGRKLVINPNTHATVIGLVWASISFRLGVKLPQIVEASISILSDGGLGMAMFSLGLFMASQAKIIACGTKMAMLAMAMKFIVGPVIMLISSTAIGLRGLPFRTAVMQAALPQGIVPFVFAKEYNVHPDILSTGIIIGLLVAIPVALGYYSLLASL